MEQPREIIEIDVDSTKGIMNDNANVDPTTEFLDPTKGIMNDNTKANKVVYGVPRSFQAITDTFEGFRKKQAAKSQEPTQEIMEPEIKKPSIDETNISKTNKNRNIKIKRVN
ncbi:12660_t:CDS:2, partial [Funneliformis mosseae]